MNASIIHVNFAPAIPRTIWYRSDILPVVLAGAFALVAIFISSISIQPTIKNITQQDIALRESHTRLADETAAITAELNAVSDIQKTRDSVLQARQSGLVVAQQIVNLGNSLGNDGVATHIDSKGNISGIAHDFPSLTRIWNRLGPNYAVVVADPAVDGSVTFTIAPVTNIPTPPPIANPISATEAGGTKPGLSGGLTAPTQSLGMPR